MSVTLLAASLGAFFLLTGITALRRESALPPWVALLFVLLQGGAAVLVAVLMLVPPPGDLPAGGRAVVVADQALLREPEGRRQVARLQREAEKAGLEGRVFLLARDEGQPVPGGVQGVFRGPGAAEMRARWEAAEAERGSVMVLTESPSPPSSGGPPVDFRWIRIPREALRPLRSVVLSSPVFTGQEAIFRIRLLPGIGAVKVLFLADGRRLGEGSYDPARKGSSPEIAFPHAFPRTGRVPVLIEVRDPSGTLLQREGGTVSVLARPRVRYVALPGQDPPLETLLRSRGFAVEPRSPSSLLAAPALAGPASPLAAAGEGDLVILDNVPPQALGPRVVEEAVRAVTERGASILLIPGNAPWSETVHPPVERLLPLRLGVDRKNPEEKSLALVAVVDTSFSMYFEHKGLRKIDMAKKALVNLSSAMRSGDLLGVLGVDTEPYWVFRPGELPDQESQVSRIGKIGAFSGGINFYSGLKAAAEELDQVSGDLKHILLLMDTEDVDEYEVRGGGTVMDLARSLRQDGISVSIVGIGESSDVQVPFLNQFAEGAGGYLYLASDLRDVPQFFLEDLEEISQGAVERRPMEVRFPAREFPLRKEMPGLAGQVLTTPKPGGTLLAWSDRGHPLFAFWRMGRGSVGVFAADSGTSLAPFWFGKDQGPLWDELLARMIPRKDMDPFLAPAEGGERVFLRTEALPSAGRGSGTPEGAETPPGGDPTARIYLPGKEQPREVEFSMMAPGEYEAFLPGEWEGGLLEVGGGAFRGLAPSGKAGKGETLAELAKVRWGDPRPREVILRPLERLRDAPVFRLLILLAAGLFIFHELFRPT